MADGDLRKGVKRATSERDDHKTAEGLNCEEPRNTLEPLEAKRLRVLSDIYNSDTGTTPFVWIFPVWL